ncbi:MAG: STAS-like domain-containing protein [Salinispira sp.]
MSNQIKITVADIIGSQLCISTDDGQKIFDKVKPLVKKGERVTISFKNVTMLISAFLNVAIGQLYGPSFNENAIRRQVKFEGLSSDDEELLHIVVDNAKKYYSNKEGYDKARQEIEDEE